ncbi:MAG: Wzz/FepE/Etk N-terminal domain-containing protein [Acidimicrobiales bacterium]
MAQDAAELDLRRYLGILRRRKATIVVTVLVMVAGAVGVSLLQTPVYQGEARLLLRGTDSLSGEGAPSSPTWPWPRRSRSSRAAPCARRRPRRWGARCARWGRAGWARR